MVDVLLPYGECEMSDFLFARPSVLEGAGRVIDLFGVLQVYNSCDTPAEADATAMAQDIAALKTDFRGAWATMRRRHESKA